MIDLEGLATGPDTTILTIAAQSFDPFGQGYSGQSYYARVTLESQEDRAIDQGTIGPMIENHRTGLIWKLFMQAPEVKVGLKTLGFSSRQYVF